MSKKDEDVNLRFRRLQADSSLAMARIRRRTEQRATQLLADSGLAVTAAQANAMQVLFAAREPITARKLADGLGVSEVTVARFVKALVAGGWVDRKPFPGDARASLLVPTPVAYEMLPKFIDVSNTILDETFDGFSHDEVEQLSGVIDRVRTNLGC